MDNTLKRSSGFGSGGIGSFVFGVCAYALLLGACSQSGEQSSESSTSLESDSPTIESMADTLPKIQGDTVARLDSTAIKSAPPAGKSDPFLEQGEGTPSSEKTETTPQGVQDAQALDSIKAAKAKKKKRSGN